MAVNSSSQEKIQTREQVKQAKKQQNEENKAAQSKGMVRVRLFPIWLRVIMIVLLAVVSLCVGAVVGYSVMGDGKASDTFKTETWTHIFDLVNKE